eukprot:9473504-Pyramimonas_sp.AAC.1
MTASGCSSRLSLFSLLLLVGAILLPLYLLFAVGLDGPRALLERLPRPEGQGALLRPRGQKCPPPPPTRRVGRTTS